MKLVIGVDIGGSHVTSQLIDLKTSTPIEESKVRVSVDNQSPKQEILNHWVEAIRKTSENITVESLAGIGFAMPGPFDYPNGIAWFDKNVKKFRSLHSVNVREQLQYLLNLPTEFPIRFLNDAASFAVGEAWHGEPSKYNRIIALTLGTGFGTTFIKNKLPVVGKEGVPDDGFLYHIPFQNSIADDYFSTRWFEKEYKKRTGEEISGVKSLVEQYHTNETAKEIFKLFGIGEIYAVQFDHYGEENYALRFEQEESWDYFDEKGQSLRKTFLKAPLEYYRVSSRFSHGRMHPILRIRRPHHGVDYAAPSGTPVMSIGDGTVVARAYQRGGGGNYIKVKHNSAYTTTYMHLSGFAKGIHVGKRVRQGDVIGFVGSTGLSTGPHLDFRVHFNGRPQDPLKIKADPVEPVKEEYMTRYNAVKDSLINELQKIVWEDQIFAEN